MRETIYDKINRAVKEAEVASGRKPGFLKKLIITERTIHENTEVYLIRRCGINSRGKFYFHFHTTKVTRLR